MYTSMIIPVKIELYYVLSELTMKYSVKILLRYFQGKTFDINHIII